MNHADLRRTEVCVHVVRVCREARAPLLFASSIKAALDRDWSDQAEKASAVKSLVIELENLKDWLVANLAEELKKPPLSDQALKQLMAQDLEPDPGGGGMKIREGVAEDRRVSIEDPEMRHGRKSKTKRFNGYKRHIATDLDSGLILSGAITPANRPSGRGSRAQPGRRHHPAGVRDRRALHRPRLREVPARRRKVLGRGGEIVCRPCHARLEENRCK